MNPVLATFVISAMASFALVRSFARSEKSSSRGPVRGIAFALLISLPIYAAALAYAIS